MELLKKEIFVEQPTSTDGSLEPGFQVLAPLNVSWIRVTSGSERLGFRTFRSTDNTGRLAGTKGDPMGAEGNANDGTEDRLSKGLEPRWYAGCDRGRSASAHDYNAIPRT